MISGEVRCDGPKCSRLNLVLVIVIVLLLVLAALSIIRITITSISRSVHADGRCSACIQNTGADVCGYL